MTLATSSLLKQLGALVDHSAIQHDDAARRLRIGPYCVHAGEHMTRWFKRTYRISAVINTSRSISLVESEMPVDLEFEDAGFAWLAAILGRALPNDVKPARLLKGERLTGLLRGQMST